MGIIAVASGNSCWRGLDYYKAKKVIKLNRINENEYTSIVNGTKNYNVYLNIEHPRKSTCDCPLAKGRRVICKHIVATYFSAIPKEAINFEKEQNKLQKEYEDEQNKIYEKAIKYINKMSKNELIEELIHVFNYGPEWLYDDFIRRNYIN